VFEMAKLKKRWKVWIGVFPNIFYLAKCVLCHCDAELQMPAQFQLRQNNIGGVRRPGAMTYSADFLLYAMLAVGALVMIQIIARSWSRSWVGSGERALDGLRCRIRNLYRTMKFWMMRGGGRSLIWVRSVLRVEPHNGPVVRVPWLTSCP